MEKVCTSKQDGGLGVKNLVTCSLEHISYRRIVFFAHNKLVNNTFLFDFSVKQTSQPAFETASPATPPLAIVMGNMGQAVDLVAWIFKEKCGESTGEFFDYCFLDCSWGTTSQRVTPCCWQTTGLSLPSVVLSRKGKRAFSAHAWLLPTVLGKESYLA